MMADDATGQRFIAVSAHEIKIGDPLPWSIYDAGGNLLLRRGFRISNQRMFDGLASYDLLRLLEESPQAREGGGGARPGIELFDDSKFTVFELVSTLLDRLERVFSMFNDERQRAMAPFKLLQMAIDIQSICNDNPDAVLGSMQIDQNAPYGLMHPLHIAVLSEMVSKEAGVHQVARISMVAAALTIDIGFIELQQKLQKQSTPLSDDQWSEVRRHPQQSAQLLIDGGVTDKPWLDTVLQHHERINGKGYPAGLAGDQISFGARLMAIADMYTAMIRPRSYRTAVLAKDVLKGIFKERGESIDGRLAEFFIKVIGIFPPGAYVRLANGEIAVVSERGDNAAHPKVISCISQYGLKLPEPVERNTQISEYAVEEILAQNEHDWAHSTLSRSWPLMYPINLG